MKYLIVGLGLIGGSYASGLKNKGYEVSAIDIDQSSIDYALENNLIDYGSTTNDIKLINSADFVIFGLYPTLIIEWIKENQQYLKANTLITDVSGVKVAIVEDIKKILRSDVEFIFSHPMAGKAVSGVFNSSHEIFTKANFIITPTSDNTQRAIDEITKLAQVLNFRRICTLSIEEHDEMIAFLSQLTHVIAVSLMNTNDSTHLKEYTGDSFKDLTRIADINEHLWSELFLTNKTNLLKHIDLFIDEITHFRDVLANEDIDEMKRLFIQSSKRRRYFNSEE